MTTTTATTAAQVASQWAAAGPDDVIEVTGGVKTALTLANATKLGVIIKAQDPDNPPIFQGGAYVLNLTNMAGVELNGLIFKGTNTVTKGGKAYPTGVGSMLDRVEAVRVLNCIFRDFDDLMQTKGVSTAYQLKDLHFERNDFLAMARDGIQFYRPVEGLYMGYNFFGEDRIYVADQHTEGRHPDFIQVATLGSATLGMKDVVMEYNMFVGTSQTGKGIYFQNEKAKEVTFGSAAWNLIKHRNIKLHNNYTYSGRTHGLTIANADAASEVTRNVIRKATGATEAVGLSVSGRMEDVLISNNVMPKAIYFYSGALSSDSTQTPPNAVSATAWPTGYVQLIHDSFANGGNVGPYSADLGGEPVPVLPTQMTRKFQEAPADTTLLRDGGVNNTYDAGNGLYGAVVSIPDAGQGVTVKAPAYDAVVLDVENLEWRGPDGVIRKFVRGNPILNGAGWVRSNAVPDPVAGGNGGTYGLVTAGQTFSGMEFRWTDPVTGQKSAWSAGAGYPDSFTAPGSPPPPDPILIPLAADEWAIHTAGREVIPGFFTYPIYPVAAEAPAGITGFQWRYPGDGVWRNTVPVGVYGGSVTYELQPLEPNGVEHLVSFAGEPNDSLTFDVRYSTGGSVFSAASVTTKTMQGPEPLPPVSPYEVGQRLKRVGGGAFTIAGRQATFPRPSRPGVLSKEDADAVIAGGTITVNLPSGLPQGAVGQAVFYAGKRYVVTDGVVTFPEVPGITFMLARAFDAGNPPYHGDAIYLFAHV